MKRLILMLTIAITFLNITPAMAVNQQNYELVLKLNAGQSYHLRTTATTRMVPKTIDKKDEYIVKGAASYSFHVIDIDEESNYRLLVCLDDIERDITIVEIGKSQSGSLADEIKDLLTDAPYFMEITKYGEITKIEGEDEALSKCVKAIFEMDMEVTDKISYANMLKKNFNEAYLKTGWEGVFAYLPKKSVKVGESWSGEYRFDQPLPMNFMLEYTLKSVNQNDAVIEINGGVHMDSYTENQGNIKNLKADGNMTGQIIVDITNGWVKSMLIETNFSGIASNDMEYKGESEIIYEISIKETISD